MNATESGTHALVTASKGTNQDTERMRPRVALTLWRQHGKGQVRIRKECDREWHSISGDGIVRTNQDTERMRPRVALTLWRRHHKGQVRIRKECNREWHSPPGDGIVRDKSGYGKKRPRVALTIWRRHRNGQVRIRKGCDREWHSPTGDSIVKDKSGYGMNATESGTHVLVTASKGTNQDAERMRPRVALTLWRQHGKGQVRIWKECDREWHSPTGDGIVKDKSG